MLGAERRATARRTLGVSLRNDDATLVRRTQAGEEQAFAAIFERHHPPLLAYCRHMLGNRDDGEDALQQAFIKAHRALLGGTAPRELRPWLYAIARNCCLSAIAARRPTVPLEDRAPALAGLSEEVHRREDLRELLEGIGRLPEDQRSALLLAELDDLSHQAIATVLGCQVSKVKALVYQARSTLIADRDARQKPCQEIREELAVARAGELRRGPLRRHLKLCSGCRDFQLAVGAQRQSLAAILPVAPSAGLMAAVLGHGSAHLAGAAGMGSGAGAGVTSAAGAGAASTSVGTVVGSGLVTKLAVGGAVVALAAAGTVATHRRQPAADSSRVAVARLAGFAARGSGLGASGGGPSDISYDSAAGVAASGTGGRSFGVAAQASSTALDGTGVSGAFANADLFPAPAGGAEAQQLLAPSGTGSSNTTVTTVSRRLRTGKPAANGRSLAPARKARAQKLRARLRREAQRRRALRLREARRRARLRKERRKTLRRRRQVAPKPVKAVKPPTPPVTPVSVRTRRRRTLSSATPLNTATTSPGDEDKQPTAHKRRPAATSTSAGSTPTTGTTSQTSTTATGSAKSKTGSSGSTEKAGSTSGAGKSGTAPDKETPGSSGGGKETGTGARGGQTGDPESAPGKTGSSGASGGEEGNTTTHKSEASGGSAANGKGSSSNAKKHLVEEEQLPNL